MSKSSSSRSTANKKAIKNEWNQCNNCGIIILKHLNEAHECSLILDDSFINTPFSFENLCYLNLIEHPKGY